MHKPLKQEKHNTIKLLIQSMLDYKADIISQAIPDRTSHPLKFIVLQVVEKYCKLKDIVRSQAKTKVKQITKEHREELLEQRRKKDKEDLFRKIMSRMPMSFKEGCHPFTNCDFIVYKDYKINLEFILTASIINLFCLLSCHDTLLWFSRDYPKSAF